MKLKLDIIKKNINIVSCHSKIDTVPFIDIDAMDIVCLYLYPHIFDTGN